MKLLSVPSGEEQGRSRVPLLWDEALKVWLEDGSSCDARDGGKFLHKSRKPQHSLCVFLIPMHTQNTVGLGFRQERLQQQSMGVFPKFTQEFWVAASA